MDRVKEDRETSIERLTNFDYGFAHTIYSHGIDFCNCLT